MKLREHVLGQVRNLCKKSPRLRPDEHGDSAAVHGVTLPETVELDSHALYVPVRPTALACAWQIASAPSKPPKLPSTFVDVVNTAVKSSQSPRFPTLGSMK